MLNRPSILFIAGTLGQGGAEKQLYHLNNLLKNKGYEVFVIVLTKGDYYENLLIKSGVLVYNIARTQNKILKLSNIYSIIRNINPNIIYSFHFYTNTYAGIVGKLLRIKTIGSIRNDGISEKTSNGIFSWFHYSLPDLIIANSLHGSVNAQNIFFKRHIKILPNIVKNDYIPSYRPKSKSSSIQLLFIGRMTKAKRPQLFIELTKILLTKGKKVEATMIGNGNLLNEIKSIAQGLPIIFKSNIENVVPFFHLADFLVSTSEHEGTPNVILEAFSCCTPVLALNHEGLSNWINLNLINSFTDIEQMSLFILQNKLDAVNDQISRAHKYITDYHSENQVSLVLDEVFNNV